MDYRIDSVSSVMIEEYTRKMDQLIQHKLKQLEMKSLQEGDYDLFSILKDIDTRNIEKTQLELQRHGYSLELVQPQPKFIHGKWSVKATIDTEQMKLIVKKVVFEI